MASKRGDGGSRFGRAEIFVRVLSCPRYAESVGRTFEQSLLVYHCLKENEDPHGVKLNNMDIWIQVYDLPNGFVSENIFRHIGNYVGEFVKSDPANLNGGWRLYSRIRVTLEIDKPIKRRMKIKREGGEWSWINFKYERLSSFCFVCGILGHQERDCAIVYANPEKEIIRSYGAWLRAPAKNAKSTNLGAKWLRNGGDSSKDWEEGTSTMQKKTTVHGSKVVDARFMDVDGVVTENFGRLEALKWYLEIRETVWIKIREEIN